MDTSIILSMDDSQSSNLPRRYIHFPQEIQLIQQFSSPENKIFLVIYPFIPWLTCLAISHSDNIKLQFTLALGLGLAVCAAVPSIFIHAQPVPCLLVEGRSENVPPMKEDYFNRKLEFLICTFFSAHLCWSLCMSIWTLLQDPRTLFPALSP